MDVSGALSLLGWYFLPKMVTALVQFTYYSIRIRAGDPRPAPNSARYEEHRRRIHILVVSAYLLYTVYEADWQLRWQSDYYTDLGLSHAATEKEIKSRFRRLAALHHPDKAGSGSGGPGGGQHDDVGTFFMHLKTAADTLTDPVRRFAYERFGPDVVEWKACSTIRDYVGRGASQLALHYGFTAVSLYVLGLVGYLKWGQYWRWLTLVLLAVFELRSVTRPDQAWLVRNLLNPMLSRLIHHPPFLPFQLILLARKISLTVFVALSQLGPLLQPAAQSETSELTAEKALQQNLDRLEQLTGGMDLDANRLLEFEMAPFAGDPETTDRLRNKLKEWLVQNTIRSDPMVRDALGRSMSKRRMDAPMGARGTR